MIDQMVIIYTNTENFYKGIVAAVEAGLTFKADGDELRIAFTGGF